MKGQWLSTAPPHVYVNFRTYRTVFYGGQPDLMLKGKTKGEKFGNDHKSCAVIFHVKERLSASRPTPTNAKLNVFLLQKTIYYISAPM